MGADRVLIIGGGLAGCEAAWQVARRGIRVVLFEMKPRRFSPAHRSELLAELVCSNSLRSESLEDAAGLLKEELRRLDSLIMRAADRCRVPAGKALAVDRQEFSAFVTRALEAHPLVEVVRQEVTELPPERPLIVATGPLTSAALAERIAELTGQRYLYFYDAIAPIVEASSIDRDIAFPGSRQGGEDYLNCPLSREEYYRFVEELLRAEKVPLREFERLVVFEGCMPIEVMAERSPDALAFGPMRPVGLVDPRTGRRPFAVVQLRQEDRYATMYNMVGFQTRLTWPEQRRVFRMIPGLQRAEFVRYGSMHRNTFLNAPRLLKPTLQFRGDEGLLFAGQITGVEGYLESTAMGLLAGINAARLCQDRPPVVPPSHTMIGALCAYITSCDPARFQPMRANFGLLGAGRRRQRPQLVRRALEALQRWKELL